MSELIHQYAEGIEDIARRITKAKKRTSGGRVSLTNVFENDLDDLINTAVIESGDKKAAKRIVATAKQKRSVVQARIKAKRIGLKTARLSEAKKSFPTFRKLVKARKWLGAATVAIPLGILATQRWDEHQQERAKEHFCFLPLQVVTYTQGSQIPWTQAKQPLPQYRPIRERKPGEAIYHPRIPLLKKLFKDPPLTVKIGGLKPPTIQTPSKLQVQTQKMQKQLGHLGRQQKLKAGRLGKTLLSHTKIGVGAAITALAFKEIVDLVTKALRRAEVSTPDIRIDVEPMVGYSLEVTERYFKLPININLLSSLQLTKLREVFSKGLSRLRKGAMRNAFAFYVGLITAELLSRGFTRTKHDVKLQQPIRTAQYASMFSKRRRLKQVTSMQVAKVQKRAAMKKRLKRGATVFGTGVAAGVITPRLLKKKEYASPSKMVRKLLKTATRGDLEARSILKKSFPQYTERLKRIRRQTKLKGIKQRKHIKGLKRITAAGLAGGGTLAAGKIALRRRHKKQEGEQKYFSPHLLKARKYVKPVWKGTKTAYPHVKTVARGTWKGMKIAGRGARSAMELAFMGIIGKEVAGEIKGSIRAKKERQQVGQQNLGV